MKNTGKTHEESDDELEEFKRQTAMGSHRPKTSPTGPRADVPVDPRYDSLELIQGIEDLEEKMSKEGTLVRPTSTERIAQLPHHPGFDRLEGGEDVDKLTRQMNGLEPVSFVSDILSELEKNDPSKYALYATTFTALEDELQKLDSRVKLHKNGSLTPDLVAFKGQLSKKPYLAHYVLNKIKFVSPKIKSYAGFKTVIAHITPKLRNYSETSLHEKLDEYREMQSQILETVDIVNSDITETTESTRSSIFKLRNGWVQDRKLTKERIQKAMRDRKIADEITKYVPTLDRLIASIVEAPQKHAGGFNLETHRRVKKLLSELRGRGRE
jgi:hypothetical protein